MNVLDMEADMMKPTLSVRVVVWIRDTVLGPSTFVGANSEPSPAEGPAEPSRAQPSPAGLGRARLVALHTHIRVRLIGTQAEPDSYVYGHF
jgi:hypothetical protein